MSGRGSSRRRGAQPALATEVAETTLPISELEPEPKPLKEEPEPAPEEPEVRQEELQEPQVDVKPFFLARAVLTGLADATWTEEHDSILERFAQDPSEPILTIFIDPCLGLKLDLGMPVQVSTPLFQTPR